MSSEERPNVSLQDMALMINIIDICSSRGAFKGEELMDVGQLRGKLAAFIQHAQSQPEQPPQPEPSVEAEEYGPSLGGNHDASMPEAPSGKSTKSKQTTS